MTLGRTRIADNADVDVASETGVLEGALGHAAEQHEQDALLDLVVAVDHGKETLREVRDEVLVLAHVVQLHPLLVGHRLLELVHAQILDVVVLAAELGIAGRHVVGQKGHLVGEVAHAERLEAADALVVVRALDARGRLLACALRLHLGHVGHDDERADEVAAVARLRLLHTLGAQYDLERARYAAARQLRLYLLYAHLLEVDEVGRVDVEHELLAIGALRIATRVGLRVLELLLHVLDHRLTVEADERAADELRVDGMRARHLGGDAHERADLDGRQLAQLGALRDVLERDVELLVGRYLLLLGLVGRRAVGQLRGVQTGRVVVLDKVAHRIAQIRMQPVDLLVYGVAQALVVLLHVGEVHAQRAPVGSCQLLGLRDVLLRLRVLGKPFERRKSKQKQHLDHSDRNIHKWKSTFVNTYSSKKS